jgi:hypothetical protein
MKFIPGAVLVLAGMLVFAACAGEPPKIIIRPELPGETAPSWEASHILDYQNAALGEALPEWVSRFLDQGSRGVEEMAAYQNSYVFVGTSRGTNFKALGHWEAGFTAAQDFPRLAALRIETRLTGAASLYPDDEYGDFFEMLVKKASDAVYTGAVKESSCWILRQYRQYGEEGSPVQERYEFFVLTRIEKSSFQTQVQALMADINPAKSPTRDQAAAINRIRETFFEDF